MYLQTACQKTTMHSEVLFLLKKLLLGKIVKLKKPQSHYNFEVFSFN